MSSSSSSNSDNAPRRLYLDNAATSCPKPRAVYDAMVRYTTDLGASAGRGAYHEAIEAGNLITQCRQRLKTLFNAPRDDHFVFSLNCTDALNLAIKGLLHTPPAHAICTHADHNSVLRPLAALAGRGVAEVTKVPVDPTTGIVDPEQIRRAIRPDTKLIVTPHASNVTGAIQPIREIGHIASEHTIPFLVDAAQTAGHVPIDVQADHIDLLATPGHKSLLGPLGTGLLYIRPGLDQAMRPLREGGTGSQSEDERQPDFMPDKFEAGTQNAIGIVGLSEGIRWVLEKGVDAIAAHDLDLVRTFIEGVSNVDGLHYYGPRGVRDRLGVFSVRIEGLDPYELAAILESSYGILTRPGLHCAPLAHAALGTLAYGGTTRLSFGPFLTKQDVYFSTEALADIATTRTTV